MFKVEYIQSLLVFKLNLHYIFVFEDYLHYSNNLKQSIKHIVGCKKHKETLTEKTDCLITGRAKIVYGQITESIVHHY